jgi:hypothetical protein
VLESSLFLNIYNYTVQINCSESLVLRNLDQDFNNFKTEKIQSVILNVNVTKVDDLSNLIPKNIRATKQSQNSITYDIGSSRFNDFYGKGISVFNYDTETAEIFYKNSDQLHEMIYLLILSRSGKFMDRHSLHKIHACSVNKNNKNLILMMPSKGGKTTTFIELLKDSNINIISDDTPVVDIKGNIHPFSLRLGVEDAKVLEDSFPYLDKNDIYSFDRVHFSKKHLLATNKLNNKIKVSNKTILVAGFRSTHSTPKLIKVTKYQMYKQLISHMIIGIGLPLIIEYFLENSFKDSCRNMKILVTRNISAIRLLLRSDCYFLETSADISRNADKLKSLLNER